MRCYSTAKNLKLRKYLGKPKWLSEKTIHDITNFDSAPNFIGVRSKKLEATLLFVDFSQAFDSIHRGKMEQILIVYGLPKETLAAIMILCNNTKVYGRSPDGDTDYFDIVTSMLQGDTLAPPLFIISLDYVLRTSKDVIKEKSFSLAKEEAEDISHKLLRTRSTLMTALLANIPAQAESLLHSLEQTAGGIGFHVNADKTEYMCFNQRGDIFALNGGSLKLVDKFSYFGNSVSSTEKDINKRLAKASTAIDS